MQNPAQNPPANRLTLEPQYLPKQYSARGQLDGQSVLLLSDHREVMLKLGALSCCFFSLAAAKELSHHLQAIIDATTAQEAQQ